MPSKPNASNTVSSLCAILKPRKPQASRLPQRIRIWEEDDGYAAEGNTLKLSHPLLRILESFHGNLKQFDQIHSQLVLSGLFQQPLAAGRAVKNLVHSPSCLLRAVSIFSHLDYPDAFIANTILRALLNFDLPEVALHFYHHQVQSKNVQPNHYTFPLLAKISTQLESTQEGEKTHGLTVKLGLESHLFVQNSFIHMYFSFGKIESASKLFSDRFEEDLVTWNSMVDGYAKNGLVSVARKTFDEMPERDLVSWNAMIAGYMGVGEVESAEELFVAMPVRDIVSWNSMIDGYAKTGKVKVAREVFDRMPNRNLVSWNTILALYARVKNYYECLKLFDRMIVTREAKPNGATLVSVLTACANVGNLEKGKWVHSYIRDNRNIELDVLLGTALLTMYAKCGIMDSAREVFNEMPVKSVVTWNSMIMGHAMHGKAAEAFEMFFEMEERGPRPNEKTFICILSACTHAGMVLEGWWCFDLMHRVYKLEPQIEHYGCMVDLLGRAGFLKDSKDLIEKISIEPAPALWGALLSACKKHSNCELGEIVAKQLIKLEPLDMGPYVLLSNIYAAEGRWDDVEKVRSMMKENALLKTTGFSVVDLGGFHLKPLMEGDSHHKKRIIFSMLSEMGVRMKSILGTSIT
ncbi:pentatricopeptide repeat-containing protein At4g18840-like [Aristolochia californica]|uniref:pentatricopeptide repeat-containing protein At4g18840-like n=1 Tax=Aristolochia californica TaxID=171875 RepID=UPI0035DF8008